MYKDTELEALLDQDSCQTQEELVRTLEVTQQTISHRLIINDQFLMKNGGNLFIHLIYKVHVYTEKKCSCDREVNPCYS